jgi:hypothetical protein
MCLEDCRIRARLLAWTFTAFVLVAVGVALILWPTNRPSSRWPAVRRGVAVGLVLGVAWTAFFGHLSDEWCPGWLDLAIYVTGLAVAGAVVGAVERFPELVGAVVGFFALAVLAGMGKPDVYYVSHLRLDRDTKLGEFLAVLFDHAVSCRFLLFSGSGLLWGAILGVIHRCFRSTRTAPGVYQLTAIPCPPAEG